jgi:hypothetical protein
MDLMSKSDEEIVSIADPIWENLTQGSNEINYEKFSKHFSRESLKAMPEEELKRQAEIRHQEVGWVSPEREFIGCIRRESGITILWKGRFAKGKGECLAQMTLGEEDGEIKVFGAFIG